MIRLEVFSPSLEALCMPIMLYIFALQHSDTHDSFNNYTLAQSIMASNNREKSHTYILSGF